MFWVGGLVVCSATERVILLIDGAPVAPELVAALATALPDIVQVANLPETGLRLTLLVALGAGRF